MNKTTRLLEGLLIAAIATSCGTGGKNQPAQTTDPLANSPVVGQYVQAGDNKVLSCDQKFLKDTISIPLSYFTEELEIVKLDNRDEALVGQAGVTISENYILIYGMPPAPFKLFDRKGNFLTNIGAVGNGPGEYQFIIYAQLDEQNNRIYLLPWNASQLLVYDLQGKVLDPVPFCNQASTSAFYVDPDKKTVSIVTLPMKGIPFVAWTQDLEGNPISAVEPGNLKCENMGSLVVSGFNIPDVFDINIMCIMPTYVDTLYQYDRMNNRLCPTFTLNFTNKEDVPWHGYSEWPDHFTGYISDPPITKATELGTTTTPGEMHSYIVEKQTGKGSYFKLYNDYLGDIEIKKPHFVFNNGYYKANIEPGNLSSDIELALKNPDLTDAIRKKLTDLQISIDENDNNYIMIARLKR
ncbi:6-bladed beta-propeller [uncultured Parabacteroides sp.]|uniref:6-bladed beta-propeller n=1 Tax=uncultured Parabacteroides sp. TaxID=512312 RepID=UPI00265AE833|nr:6-bladed beta-propeller [uncultured Parabacteroides sp.]